MVPSFPGRYRVSERKAVVDHVPALHGKQGPSRNSVNKDFDGSFVVYSTSVCVLLMLFCFLINCLYLNRLALKLKKLICYNTFEDYASVKKTSSKVSTLKINRKNVHLSTSR